jgi:sodium/pantothenate symporter
MDPILIGGVISLVVVIGVSRMGTVTDVERAHRLALRRTPADERDVRQVRWTQGAAIGVAASGLLLSCLLIVFYVMPFQEAKGVLLEGERLDWRSGEALLALGWAALYIPCGVGACWVIGRSYGPAGRRR